MLPARAPDGTPAVLKVAFPDAESDLPVETYVAVFGVQGIEPGLYHFCPREFSLRRLRDVVLAARTAADPFSTST